MPIALVSAAADTDRERAAARSVHPARTDVASKGTQTQTLHTFRRLPPVRKLAVAFACAIALLCRAGPAHAAPPPRNSAEALEVNEKCNVCHAVEGLSIHDPVKGRTLDLSIEPDTYAASLHGVLDCEACHSSGYERMPHSGPIRHPRFLCVDCHERRKDVEGLALTLRRDELLSGAHGRSAELAFDCHMCHDPHTFVLVRDRKSALGRIEKSNHICLSCHGPDGALRERFQELPNTLERHDLFPNPLQHMRKLKCVTCHAPEDSLTRHDVEAADKAVRECTGCHGSDARLLERTYADLRGSTTAVPLGALGAAPDDGFRDNVYVVGSTRSPLLDKLSIVGFLVMLSLVAMHAVARLLTHGRRRREAAEAAEAERQGASDGEH